MRRPRALYLKRQQHSNGSPHHTNKLASARSIRRSQWRNTAGNRWQPMLQSSPEMHCRFSGLPVEEDFIATHPSLIRHHTYTHQLITRSSTDGLVMAMHDRRYSKYLSYVATYGLMCSMQSGGEDVADYPHGDLLHGQNRVTNPVGTLSAMRRRCCPPSGHARRHQQ